MPTYDFSPLFRTVAGFDRLARLADSTHNQDGDAHSFPPYNIESVDENAYRVTLAVAGFAETDLDIQVLENTLMVTGKRPQPATEHKFLHHGIAGRDFTRRFALADTVKVAGASLDKGLLTIDLVREVPEALKPRTIGIKSGSPQSVLGKDAA
jgi:molecular chaperone IbpA